MDTSDVVPEVRDHEEDRDAPENRVSKQMVVELERDEIGEDAHVGAASDLIADRIDEPPLIRATVGAGEGAVSEIGETVEVSDDRNHPRRVDRAQDEDGRDRQSRKRHAIRSPAHPLHEGEQGLEMGVERTNFFLSVHGTISWCAVALSSIIFYFSRQEGIMLYKICKNILHLIEIF